MKVKEKEEETNRQCKREPKKREKDGREEEGGGRNERGGRIAKRRWAKGRRKKDGQMHAKVCLAQREGTGPRGIMW